MTGSTSCRERSGNWSSKRAALTPDLVMLEDEQGRSLTYAAYRDAAEAVAAGLAAQGLGSGSIVSWQLPTTVEAVVLMAALTRLDAVQNPIIPILREREVTYITKEARSDVVVAPSVFRGFDYHAMLAPIAAQQGFEILACDHGDRQQGESRCRPATRRASRRPPRTPTAMPCPRAGCTTRRVPRRIPRACGMPTRR